MVLKSFFKALGRVFRFKRKRRSPKTRRKTRKRRRIEKRRPERRRPARRVRRVRRRRAARKHHPGGRRTKARRQTQGKRQPGARLPAQPPLAGTITHYFPRVKAAVFVCRLPLSVGEPVWIKGATTNFRQTVVSMQIDRKAIDRARKGDEIGLEVLRDVRVGDHVYRMQA